MTDRSLDRLHIVSSDTSDRRSFYVETMVDQFAATDWLTPVATGSNRTSRP